jgi:hypothetical protein
MGPKSISIYSSWPMLFQSYGSEEKAIGRDAELRKGSGERLRLETPANDRLHYIVRVACH